VSRVHVVVTFFAASLLAALAPPVSAEEPQAIAITHARVYIPGDHPPLEDATVVLSGGKVLAVGASVVVPPNARTIDAHGKVVTPGFIDVGTDVGAVEIDLEAASNDTDVRSAMTPGLRMIDGYNPRSAVIPVTRAGGVTSVVVAPARGLLGGQSAFVDLAGDTVAEALVRPTVAQNAQVDEDTAQHVAGSRGGLWLMLREALEDARFYQTHRAQYDANGVRPLSLHRAGLESLVPVVRGEPRQRRGRAPADVDGVHDGVDE